MYKNKSVNAHQFAMVPRAEIPRSQFNRQSTHKTTIDSGYLIPIYLDEVLPGDTFNMSATLFARMATPIFPIMDNAYLDVFFFFVPNRLVHTNWPKLMGEKDNPDDETSYTVPQIHAPAGGYAVGSIFDYFGLPTAGQITGANRYYHSALPLRAYNLIYNSWFRDQNLVDSLTVNKDDVTEEDPASVYSLQRRGKRHDYFTSCLPWTQKGDSVSIPLGLTAPVALDATEHRSVLRKTSDDSAVGAVNPLTLMIGSDPAGVMQIGGPLDVYVDTNGLYADLSAATAATINQLRQSFQIQRLLERDARGGSRYTEIIKAHFGVQSPDARLQRPEYLGGGTAPININPIAQTSATGLTGGSTPAGNLAAFGTSLLRSGFTGSFTEHGMIIGLASVRADLTYQQGLHKMWSRETRYDFYFPAFANLGEQAVLNKEIYTQGTADDDLVFGYQERWAEYRYKPSQISGLFKSTSTGTIDGWHLAQRFTALPELTQTFIEENPPFERVLAVGASANGKQFLFDAFFDNKVARPMPLYSVPGLIDHF